MHQAGADRQGVRLPVRRISVLSIGFSLLALPLAAASQTAAPVQIQSQACERIATGPGPDDLAIQGNRLLFSSHDRRRFHRSGEIQLLDTVSGEVRTLKREGEPVGLVLRPHGIDLVQRDGEWLLHVVSHDRDLFSDNHRIVIYALRGDTLHFLQQLESPLLSAPNDIAVADNGDLYVTNERSQGSSLVELILLERKANVVVHRAGSGWRVAAGELAFANGIYTKGDKVWVTQTLGEGLMRYVRRPDGSLGNPEQLGNLSLLDSLHATPDGKLLSPAYPSLINLGLHWQLDNRKARTVLNEIDPDTGNSHVLFQDSGQQISAVSSAVILGQRLYLGQLFESYLLSCPLSTSSTARR